LPATEERCRENGEVVTVPDGIVFPILSAMSAFVTRGKKGWALQQVQLFDERELIEAAAQVCMKIADHNPQTMGKNKACYSALQRITAIYAPLGQKIETVERIFRRSFVRRCAAI
jgi:hypothetical protein